jgi:hypothetical protein
MSNFGWDYPPGVTGNEYQIAGPSREWEEKMDVECLNDECEMFDVPQEVEVSGESYRGTNTYYWECPTCGHSHDFEREEDEGPDPDAAYDAWRESMMD